MERPLSRFSMEGNVNTVSFRSYRSSWAGRRLKQPGPGRLEEGRHADGEVFLFTRTGPPETTLLPRHQVISLTHFTGGEAHRLPHLNVTCLWEREGFGYAAESQNHRKTMFHVLHNTTMSHKYPGWAFQSHLSKPPRKVPELEVRHLWNIVEVFWP